MNYESESEHSHKQQVAFLQKKHFAIFHKFIRLFMFAKVDKKLDSCESWGINKVNACSN
jgi:hypothetical protein